MSSPLGDHTSRVFDGISTKSAMNPCLWLCLIGLIILGLSIVSNGWIQAALFVAGFLPIAVGCFLLIWFGLKRPEILQSEGYRLRERAMQIYGDGTKSAAQLEIILAERPVSPQINLADEKKK